MNKTTLRVVTTADAPKLHIGKPAFIPLINGGTLYQTPEPRILPSSIGGEMNW